MHLEVSSEVLELPFRDPFRIARAEPDRVATTVVVTLRDGAAEGIGEAFPVAYYGETTGTIAAVLPVLVAAVEATGEPPADPAGARAWLDGASDAMDDAIGHNGGAKAGVDIALHDLLGRRLGLPVWKLLDAATRDPADRLLDRHRHAGGGRRARDAGGSVPGPQDQGRRPDRHRDAGGGPRRLRGPIRVDANTGWQPETGLALLPELERLGVELIEQPFPAHELGQLRWLQDRSRLPIVADESAVTIQDLEGLVGVVAGVNVKLMKCGGVGPGLRMLQRARDLGFKRMLGCMEETSLGVAAGAMVAGLGRLDRP